jgi:hypothetical protein
MTGSRSSDLTVLDSVRATLTPMCDLSLFALPLELLIQVLALLEGREIVRCILVSLLQLSLLFIPES